MDDHKWCPWCKNETDRTPECYDEDDSVWAIVCGTCRGSGPIVYMPDEEPEICQAEAWRRWDSSEIDRCELCTHGSLGADLYPCSECSESFPLKFEPKE